jgi:hypothetical protein
MRRDKKNDIDSVLYFMILTSLNLVRPDLTLLAPSPPPSLDEIF